MRALVAFACLALAVTGGLARFTSAAFTRSLAVPSSSVSADQLANHFSASPGTAVQAGTSTPIASGSVDTMTLAFGTVPSARTFSNVFHITNVTGAAQTATLTLSGAPQVASAVFAASGTTTVTLGAGASSNVNVTTSSTVAGHGSGTLKLTLSSATWEYRSYALTIDEQPEAPATLTATQAAAGRLNLSWAASTTTTNLAGYNVYRSTGGAYTKLNATPLSGTTYGDTATVDGTTYTYEIRAVTTGTPLESLDSPTATATADATPPGQPASIALANGGGAGNAYINSGNRSSLSVSVTLAAGWASSDTVSLTLASGAASVTKTGQPSSGTITFTGIDVSSFSEGAVSITATSTDAAGNASAAQWASFVKDTVAPAAPSATYTDNVNATADQITGSAEANATIAISETAPASASYGGSAGSGSYAINVAAVHGNGGHPIAFSYSVTATDVAGNTSAATVVAGSDTK